MHPLKSLIENRPAVPLATPGRESPAPVSSASVAPPSPPVLPVPAVPPRPGFEVRPGFSILAIQEPHQSVGRPDAMIFASGLSIQQQKQLAWFLATWDLAGRGNGRQGTAEEDAEE